MQNIRQNTFLCIILLSSLLFGCSTNEKKIQKIDIAILMPITGKNGEQGSRLSSVMKMGLEDGLEGHINVVTYDAANSNSANVMMNKIVNKKTKIVLGPLFSDVTSSVIAKAEENDITLITLSNNPILASNNIYVFGHAPMKQTECLISYFLSHEHKDFILFLPKTRYSETIIGVIKNMIAELDINPLHVEYYSSKEDLEKAAESISVLVDKINEDPEAQKPVIYISDDSSDIKDVLYALKQQNLDNKAIIGGDGRIDIELDYPINITFTGSLNYINERIAVSAKETLDINHLTFLDLLAYDLGRMTSHYIGYGLDHPLFVLRLNGKEYYNGASGQVRFDNNIAVRKYDIIQKTNHQYLTIEKAK